MKAEECSVSKHHKRDKVFSIYLEGKYFLKCFRLIRIVRIVSYVGNFCAIFAPTPRKGQQTGGRSAAVSDNSRHLKVRRSREKVIHRDSRHYGRPVHREKTCLMPKSFFSLFLAAAKKRKRESDEENHFSRLSPALYNLYEDGKLTYVVVALRGKRMCQFYGLLLLLSSSSSSCLRRRQPP